MPAKCGHFTFYKIALYQAKTLTYLTLHLV